MKDKPQAWIKDGRAYITIEPPFSDVFGSFRVYVPSKTINTYTIEPTSIVQKYSQGGKVLTIDFALSAVGNQQQFTYDAYTLDGHSEEHLTQSGTVPA